MDSRSSSTLRFGRFALDLVAGRLIAGGKEVALRAKSFEVLRLLASHQGQLVTKEQLFAAVWPDVVVGDDSLVQCVSEIRQSLGDDRQEIVRTIPRRGYIFTLPVREDIPTRAPTRRIARKWAAGATMVLAVAVAAWLVYAGGEKGVRGERAHTATPQDDQGIAPPLSIVVLPLSNLSADAAQEYFAEGLTEDLTTDLSRIPGSLVIARGSAYSYRGRSIDTRRVGRELGVRYLVQGSVQRIGDRVRLNVRLVEADSGQLLWADRFDTARERLPALQDQVVGTIARALHVRLFEAESKRSLSRHGLNPDAHDLALQGWSLLERRTSDSVQAAREFLQGAVALDPTNVFGLSLLSDTYTTDILNRWLVLRGASRQDWLRRAEDAAQRAYALDQSNLYTLGAMGTVLNLRGRLEDALEMFNKQVALNRNYAPAWHRMSYTLLGLARPADAIAAADNALRLSPRDPLLYSVHIVMAAAHMHLGEYEQALQWARRSAQARPGFAIAYGYVASAAAQLDRMDEARVALAEFRRLLPAYRITTLRAETMSRNADLLLQRERFYEGLRKAGLPD